MICPNCGYCPYCGRGGSWHRHHHPWVVWPPKQVVVPCPPPVVFGLSVGNALEQARAAVHSS